MSRPKVLILTALQIEAAYVATALGLRPPKHHRPSFGACDDVDVQIDVIGIAAHHLPAPDSHKPACVILAGFAGGLSPDVRVGDVLVDGAEGDWVLPPKCIGGAICHADRVVASPRDKQVLFASTKALAVDMESGRVGQWATSYQVPSIVIRAISDSAAESLSKEVLALADEYGRPRPTRIIAALARNPAVSVQLWRLARASRKSGKNLGRAVHQFIELNIMGRSP